MYIKGATAEMSKAFSFETLHAYYAVLFPEALENFVPFNRNIDSTDG